MKVLCANITYSEKISPRSLRLADGSKTIQITEMARIMLDIDIRAEQGWGYVMPNLSFPIILGKPWMEFNDVIYLAKRKGLRIGSRKHGMIVRASGWYDRDAPERTKSRVASVTRDRLAQISLVGMSKMGDRRSSKAKFMIGAVSMHDITRALEPKKSLSYEEIRERLPKEARKYTNLFLDDKLKDGSAPPPHRPGVDTKIKLVKDDLGRESEVPWGPLYGISREELLVLRKTLTELLNKN
ncbi:hypothetical protein K3495_g5797 [Podosphaera aphanis]|nr:hypothetical protein K3495_g5797 [Podosphaera aphanis]